MGKKAAPFGAASMKGCVPLPSRRKRVIAVAVSLSDFSITPMSNHITTLIPGDFASAVLRLALSIMPRCISAVPLAQNCPSPIFALHNMLVGHNWLLLEAKLPIHYM